MLTTSNLQLDLQPEWELSPDHKGLWGGKPPLIKSLQASRLGLPPYQDVEMTNVAVRKFPRPFRYRQIPRL